MSEQTEFREPRSTRGSDRNLLFGILALQMDFIGRDALIEALRDWTTQKDKRLGQILVERGDLPASRRELLEPLIDEHVRRHDNDPAASLAAISSVIDADIDWQSVVDADVAASLAARRLTRNAKRSEGASAADHGGATSSADRFRVLRPHARGGIGEVFLAFDEELHREVALKEIQSRHVRDESHRERFVREAEVTGGLEHPGIVPVYSLGHYGDGRPFYAMRFIRGDSLKEAIEKFHAERSAGGSPVIDAAGEPPALRDDINSPTVIKPEAPGGWALLPDPVAPQTPEDGQECPSSKTHVSREQFASVEFRKLLGRFIDVCQAIEYAHSRGVLHRDLKPGNIMLGKYGETLVVDWGLAKAAGKDDRFADSEEATFVPSSGSGVEQTQQGSVVGTPSYMSPEQAAGKLDQLGPTTDVYSLGATLYHILTGQAPFTAQPRRPVAANAPAPPKLSVTELLRRVQHGDFPRPREIISHVPQPLEAVCLKAMSLRPEARYTSSSALAEDIEHWLADEPVTAHREPPLATASRWVRKHRAWAMSGAAALALVAVVSSIAAYWINSQKSVIAEQERAATKLADRNAALAKDKSQLADEMIILAEQEKSARQKAEAATLAEKQAKEEEAKQRMSAIAAGEAEKKQRLLAEDSSMKAIAAQKKAEAAALAEKQAKEEEAKQRMLAEQQRQVAVTAKSQALLAQQEEAKQRELADRNAEEAHSSAYVANIRLAAAEWEAGHIANMNNALDAARPTNLRDQGKDLRQWEWNYLWNQSHSELRAFGRQNSGVRCVALSPDGKRLASAGSDGNIKLWDVRSGDVILTLAHLAESVAFSPNGERIAAGCTDKTVKIWDIKSGQLLHSLSGHTYFVWCVAFSPDGKMIASGSGDGPPIAYGFESEERLFRSGGKGTVKLWDAANGQELRTFQGHAGDVTSVVFSPDGTRVVTASFDQTLKVWNVGSGLELNTLIGHLDEVTSVAFHPSGQRIISASRDRTLKIWDAGSGMEMATLRGHKGAITSVTTCSAGRWIVSGSTDATVMTWDESTGYASKTLKGHSRNVTTVTANRVNDEIISGSDDGSLKVWNLECSADPNVIDRDSGEIFKLVFNRDGTEIVTFSRKNNEGQLSVHDMSCFGQTMRSFSLDGGASYYGWLGFTTDGKLNVAGFRGSTPNLIMWDGATGNVLLTRKSTLYMGVTVSPDGARIVTANRDGSLNVWNAISGEDICILAGHKFGKIGIPVGSVAFSPDGQKVVSQALDGTIKVWDANNGREKLAFDGHTRQLTGVSFSPDGKRIASVGERGALLVWDSDTGNLTLTLVGHTRGVTCVAFSQDGKRIVSGSLDRTLKLWDAKTGNELLTLKGHNREVSSVAFSPNNHQIVSGSIDGTLIMWDGRSESDSHERSHEREARSALTFQRAKVGHREELLTALRNDHMLSDLARQKALTWASKLPLNFNDRLLDNRADRAKDTPSKSSLRKLLEIGVTLEIVVPEETRQRVFTKAEQLPNADFVVVSVKASENQQVTDDLVRSFADQDRLLEVHLSGCRVTDNALNSLRGLSHLQRLWLERLPLTGKTFESLTALPLQALALGGNKGLQSEHFRHLGKITSLQYLYLNGAAVDDAAAAHLNTLHKLRLLDIGHTQITDRGLESLREMTELDDLCLNGTAITNAGLKQLKPLAKLRTLRLDQTRITDTGLAELTPLKNLQTLDLEGTPISDVAVEQLKTMKSLKSLKLASTKVTPEGINRLKQALPECKITLMPSQGKANFAPNIILGR